MPAGLTRCVLLAALAIAGGWRAASAQDAATACRDQASGVERALGLPPGLLLAVGRVESGRGDPVSHDVLPWPWSVNDEGEDHVFGSSFDAIAYVVAARARGSRSIDVGCFQVNLQYHPDAFANLTEAFDPATNARAAGDFLAELHGRTNSWESAVELYHSATPWRGIAYRDLVLARWAEARLVPGSLSTSAASAASTDLAAPRAPAPPPEQVVMVPRAPAGESRVAVRVQYPTAAGQPIEPVARVGRLPRVIVPSVYVAR
jgi:soluble lytic murein transglycosylase-like protein